MFTVNYLRNSCVLAKPFTMQIFFCSYILASYAKFLWDAEEEEEEEEKEVDSKSLSTNIFHGAPHHPPILQLFKSSLELI